MVFVPMNVDEDHWWLVVINLAKQEWQILDSYDRTLEYYIEVTRSFVWPLTFCISYRLVDKMIVCCGSCD